MSETHASTEDHYKPGLYEIRIRGHFDDKWAAWFDGVTITLEDNGDTLLTGPVIDQAALHGLLSKVRDLGVLLISVRPVEPGSPTTPRTDQADVSDVRKEGETNLDTNRRIAIITGVVFIIATAAALPAKALVPDPTGVDYLTSFSANANRVATGVLFYLIGYFACAGIAVVMYPVLKKWNAALALGSVIFRTIETVFYTVGVVCLLSLLTIGQQFTSAVAADRMSLQAIGDLLLSVHQQAGLAGVFAFCLGALMYYTLFFQSRLIPRWLSGWGIVAIISMLTACVLSLFSGNRITSYIPLAFPIFLQEMALAVWLIVKGFDPSAVASLSAKTATSELLSAA